MSLTEFSWVSHCLLCDLKLQVEVAKQKIIARHIAHQSQDYGLLGVLVPSS